MKPPDELSRMVERAEAALRAVSPGRAPGRPAGLAGQLDAAAASQGGARRAELGALAAELRGWFRGQSQVQAENDGFCHVEIPAGALECRIGVFPPRKGGRQLSSEDCFRELDVHQVTSGVDSTAVRAAVAEMQSSGEPVVGVLAAAGRPPGEPRAPRVELSVPHLDKAGLRLDTRWLLTSLPTMLREVQENQAIGRVQAGAPGAPGLTVRGKPVPPREAAGGAFQPGQGVVVREGGEIVTAAPGVPVLDGSRLEVMPLFLVEGDYAPPSPEIVFRGLVVVLGSLSGQRVEADELIVVGNCDRSEIHCSGDVMVGGGVVGRNAGKVFADGRVAARHVSDAEIEALGDVIVTNTITHSNVTSNARVKVTAERGAIVGGRVAALRGIEARSLGSDFGTYTVTAAGRDFLTDRRLERLREVIRVHEENLARITALKEKMARANVDVRKLAPEKQDIYLGVLRKEARSRAELASLTRRRDRLDRALADVLEATIRIREELYPPVRVEIADAIREIEERLRSVVVYRDRREGIVTRQNAAEDPGASPAPGAPATRSP